MEEQDLTMKTIKKFLISILALLMCLLTACGGGETEETSSETSADNSAVICADGASEYQIVFSMTGERAMRKTAVALSAKIKELTGVEIPYVNDSKEEKEKEILIGDTARAENGEELADREILITEEGSKIAIYGVNEDIIDAAVEMFVGLMSETDGKWTMSGLPARKVIEDTEKHIELTVATFNLHEGGYHELAASGTKSPDFTKIGDDILQNEIDVVAFQEIDCKTRRNFGQDTLKVIAEYLESKTGQKYYYEYGVATTTYYETADPDRRIEAGTTGTIGVGVLSKYPIKEANEYKMTVNNSANNCVLLETVIEVEGENFVFYSSHNDQGVIKTQLAEIYAQAKKHSHYIVAGDFNWHVWQDFDDAFPNTTKANNAGTNIVTTKNGQMFDNIIFSENIVGSNAHAIDTGHTDHFLLISDVIISYVK